MGTLSVQPKRKHGAVFWVLLSLLIVLVIVVIVVVLLLLFDPGLADAIFIFVTYWTGHGGGVPQ